MVGGSTDVSSENLDELVLRIKAATHLPVIYFPSSAGAMSPHVDAIYFLSVLNSRDPRHIVGEQAVGAPFLRAMGIEPISMGYIIVDPGMKVGAVSAADVVPRTMNDDMRAAGLALAAAAFACAPPSPAPGEAWITTLDVGQGLAVLVRTANRTLVYDAGPTYGTEADSGGRVVLPALRGEGIGRLDELVLSHEDADHIGGAQTLLESIEVDALVSSLPRAHPLLGLAAHASPCAAGAAWDWDGVRFEMLSPPAAAKAVRRNDLSCVLRVASAGGAILLTGDIERAAEGMLLETASSLRSNVLLVPHHGSRTSSTAAFIAAVAPQWGIVPAGYRNRFGHPNGEVVGRYAGAGVRLLRTDLDGAVHVRLGPSGIEVAAERSMRPRYWRARPLV